MGAGGSNPRLRIPVMSTTESGGWRPPNPGDVDHPGDGRIGPLATLDNPSFFRHPLSPHGGSDATRAIIHAL